MSKEIICASPYHIHPWTDSCISSWAGMFATVFTNGMKIYIPLFVIPALLFKKKGLGYLLRHTSIEILRSSAFLGFYASTIQGYLCVGRRFWKDDRGVHALVGGVIAGWSLLLERKSRRADLALYCLNQALEIWYRTAAGRGYVKMYNHGQVLVMMLASSILFYFYQHEPENMRSNMRSLLKHLVQTN